MLGGWLKRRKISAHGELCRPPASRRSAGSSSASTTLAQPPVRRARHSDQSAKPTRGGTASSQAGYKK